MTQHQYVERDSGLVRSEELYADRIINFLYSRRRENPHFLYKAVSSAWLSKCLAFINYDAPLGDILVRNRKFLKLCGVDFSECLDRPDFFNTARKIFERKIRYWIARPMSDDPQAVVSPADSRVLLGSFQQENKLFIKDKFFDFRELIGLDKPDWVSKFSNGDFAIFRLTPDKYHYNHVPVSGKVVDFYEIDGLYHSCNPGAVVVIATPYSKNRRIVTVIDTDVDGGTGVGMVAMIEVVALMIGKVVQCYSEKYYDQPSPMHKGLFLKKGQPKSLFRPGSSTDILIFEENRIEFSQDLVTNLYSKDATSRFSSGFASPLVETNINVRSIVARKKNNDN